MSNGIGGGGRNQPNNNNSNGMRCCVMCGISCLYGSTTATTSATATASSSSSSSNGKQKQKKQYNNVHANIKNNNSNNSSTVGTIPTQNKGVCTVCDVNVWIIINNDDYHNDNTIANDATNTSTNTNTNTTNTNNRIIGQQIKWCKGCKNFKLWSKFGGKGHATKCGGCRDRQKTKYAAKKKKMTAAAAC